MAVTESRLAHHDGEHRLQTARAVPAAIRGAAGSS
jgi:hypothetical protein